MHYAYTRVTSKGGDVTRSNFVLSSAQLQRETGEIGELAFLRLLDKWNRTGILGLKNGGPLYVYVATIR